MLANGVPGLYVLTFWRQQTGETPLETYFISMFVADNQTLNWHPCVPIITFIYMINVNRLKSAD